MENNIIFIGGTPCTGKSYLARELTREIPTAFLLEKDVINGSLCRVRKTHPGADGSSLMGLDEYLELYAGDLVTESGSFDYTISVPSTSEFFGRHVRDQTYMAMVDIAKRNLSLGKTPVIEGLMPRHFSDGTARNLINELGEDQTKFIYTHTSEDVLRRRMISRYDETLSSQNRDPNSISFLIDKRRLSSEIEWQSGMETYPIFPKSFGNIPHLKVDTGKEIGACVSEVLDYIGHS